MQSMMLNIALALSILAPAGSSATAQPRDADVGDLAPFLVLFPELRRQPAPSWLVPGVRVSYQSAGAVIGSATPASGAGIIQYDVTASNAERVLAYQHAYADGGAGLYPLSTGFAQGFPGVGPFWLHPSVLRNAERVGNAALSVTRSQRSLGGAQPITVVRFESTQGGRSVWEFDAATGLLILDSIAAGGSAAQLSLAGVRQLTLPFAPARAPNWVRPGARVLYEGAESTTIPSAGTFRNPGSAAMEITQAGARWSLNTLAVTLGGQRQGADIGATGEGQLQGALWLPRSALQGDLPTTATTVDEDPITGARVLLQRAANGEVALQQQTSGSRTTWFYDRALGVLNRLVQEVQLETAFKQTELVRTGGGSDLSQLAQQLELPEDAPAGQAGRRAGGCSAASQSDVGGLAVLACVLALCWMSRRRRGGARA